MDEDGKDERIAETNDPWWHRALVRLDGAMGAARRRWSRLRRRATSTAHWLVLIFGLVVVVLGFYLIIAAYYSGAVYAPLITLPVIGVIMVVLGLAETLSGYEEHHKGRGSRD